MPTRVIKTLMSSRVVRATPVPSCAVRRPTLQEIRKAMPGWGGSCGNDMGRALETLNPCSKKASPIQTLRAARTVHLDRPAWRHAGLCDTLRKIQGQWCALIWMRQSRRCAAPAGAKTQKVGRATYWQKRIQLKPGMVLMSTEAVRRKSNGLRWYGKHVFMWAGEDAKGRPCLADSLGRRLTRYQAGLQGTGWWHGTYPAAVRFFHIYCIKDPFQAASTTTIP